MGGVYSKRGVRWWLMSVVPWVAIIDKWQLFLERKRTELVQTVYQREESRERQEMVRMRIFF